MSESFAVKLRALKVRLQNNQPLNAFCAENFEKPLKVLRLFKAPDEVEISDLPMIFITHPSVRRLPGGNDPASEHTASAYGIFFWPDESEAQLEEAADLMVTFEELIEAAVRTRTNLPEDAAIVVGPGSSDNDEGMYHPVYGTKLDFIIKTR